MSLQQSLSLTLAATGNLTPSGGGGGGGSGSGGGGGGGGSGGGGGGGGSGGGGGAPTGGGGNANTKLLGGEPEHFKGNRQDVDRFLADLITYIDLNSQNPALASFKTRVRMALSFMSGETIRHWKMLMLKWARPVAMPDNQALWDQFLIQFRAKYADTQRGNQAQETINTIKMKGIAIDQYISDFVRLAEDAQYDLGATGTWRFFLRGLPRDVGVEVIKANPQDWATLRQTTVNATNAWNHINIAFGNRFSSVRSQPEHNQ